MIIKAKLLPKRIILFLARVLAWFLAWKFNKVKIEEIEIRKGHSYMIMCNHFSFWDGFFACYLAYKVVYRQEPNLRGFNIMSLKKQLEKHPWLTRIGSFSIEPGSPSVSESLAYAAEILSTPGNVFLFYPQAMLESNHVRQINLKPGIIEIMKGVKGDCQLIWSSNLIEYFESLKPSVYCYLLDCGTNHDFNFEQLSAKINKHHKASIQKQIRYTTETD